MWLKFSMPSIETDQWALLSYFLTAKKSATAILKDNIKKKNFFKNVSSRNTKTYRTVCHISNNRAAHGRPFRFLSAQGL